MAFNVRSGGKASSVEVLNTVKSGDVVRVGLLVGIAEIDATVSSEDGKFYTTLALDGIAHAPITGAVALGAGIYTATASGKATLVTATTAGNKLVGIATRAKVAGETDVWFKIVQNGTVA